MDLEYKIQKYNNKLITGKNRNVYQKKINRYISMVQKGGNQNSDAVTKVTEKLSQQGIPVGPYTQVAIAESVKKVQPFLEKKAVKKFVSILSLHKDVLKNIGLIIQTYQQIEICKNASEVIDGHTKALDDHLKFKQTGGASITEPLLKEMFDYKNLGTVQTSAKLAELTVEKNNVCNIYEDKLNDLRNKIKNNTNKLEPEIVTNLETDLINIMNTKRDDEDKLLCLGNIDNPDEYINCFQKFIKK